MKGVELKVSLGVVVSLEAEGRLEEAERLLRQVVGKAERTAPDDAELLGSLHVDLGQLAEKRGRHGAAAREYGRALEFLGELKGDAFLEAAHAHFNLARVLAGEAQAEQRLAHAEEALRRYQATPLASEADVADGRLLVAVVRAASGGEVEIARHDALLADIRTLPCDDLHQDLLHRFLVHDIVHRRLQRQPVDGVYRSLFAWAGRERVVEVLKAVQDAMPRILRGRGLPAAPAAVRRAELDGPYRDRFTDGDWARIELLPLQACSFIARNLERRDRISPALARAVSGEERPYQGPMHREMVRSLAGAELTAALQRSLELSAEELARLRAVLRERLTEDEYQELVGGMFIGQWNLAMEADGDVHAENRRALHAFALFWGLDLTLLDAGRLLGPSWDARRWLLVTNEKIRTTEALEIGAEG